MMVDQVNWTMTMPFPERLAALRKRQAMTQQSLADAIHINVSQLKRYEAGTSQPTLDVLRKLSVELNVSADVLLFDQDERGPGDDFKLQFEALRRFDEEDRKIAKALLESLILKHNAKRAFVEELS